MRVLKAGIDVTTLKQQASLMPLAIHPAVWTRATGQKVLHVSPRMSVGIEGQEDSAGDKLLEAVCQDINHKARAYRHQWSPIDVLIWDDWRILHAVSGSDPPYPRPMHRTAIKGDYGLRYFENEGMDSELLEMTVEHGPGFPRRV